MATMRKITISAPEDLIAFVDEKATRHQTSRSRVISQILESFRQAELERLAAEGYQFYADESIEFAEMTASAFAEVLDDRVYPEDEHGEGKTG